MRRVVRFRSGSARVAVVLLAMAAAATPALSEPRRLAFEPTPVGEAYLEAVERKPVSTDVDYYDPTEDAPPLKLRENAPRPEVRDTGRAEISVNAQFIVVLISAVLLAIVIAVVMRFGGTTAVSFSSKPDQRRRSTGGSRRPTVPGMAMSGADMTLADISRLNDPREAIIILGRMALRHAAEANGLGIGRSWTIRDVLRRLPRDWPHLPALYSIARAAEITHYGGRDMDVHELGEHIESARPIFHGGRA